MRAWLSAVGTLTLALTAVLTAAPAGAQTPPVRLAAGVDCPRNVNCIPGFRRVYRIDPTSLFTPLKVADAGVQALDDGVAEVAVAFSSNPQLSRPDIVTLRDDRNMISPDHVVPVVSKTALRRYGPRLRRRLDAASRLLSTLVLRGLNQQVIDGRLPEAVGGEFADANGLGGPSRRRSGPVIRVGFQAFAENATLAHLYAEALRGAGYRVRVRALGGLRSTAIRSMRRGRLDMWPDYSGSLLGHLGGRSLRRALARIGARPMELSRAQNRNGFAMKRELAAQLGIRTLSDLARYWPAADDGDSASGARVAQANPEPLQRDQWAIAPGSVLNLPDAWKLTEGRGVTIAIIDTGARLDHVDLGTNIWTNFDEIPGNGIDDDRNGYVDDVHGVDLTTRAAGQTLDDGQGHGTHVAGIAGAARNARGVVGVAPQAKLMIVKVLDSSGSGSTGSVADGIRYAAANGARVINLSLGGDGNDPRLVAAVQAAGAANSLLVCAAGNESRDIDQQPSYPAAIAAPNLLAVASTDPATGHGMSGFSNFGRRAVQLAAPGGSILSSANSGAWVFNSGTSMAAPMASGVAALVTSVNPALGAASVRAVLMQNATRSDLPVAAGYIDALRSVLAASPASGPGPGPVTRPGPGPVTRPGPGPVTRPRPGPGTGTGPGPGPGPGTDTGTGTSQPPRLRILSATRAGVRVRVRTAVLGSTAAIARYRVRLGRRVVELTPRSSPFTLRVRQRRARRARVQAINAAGNVLASAQRRVVRQRKGKRNVGTGPGVGI
jgi:subtilisin family serine protease